MHHEIKEEKKMWSAYQFLVKHCIIVANYYSVQEEYPLELIDPGNNKKSK